MKKQKQPGDNISLKTKKTEDPAVMSWINAQTNLMDSLRYLIEIEVVQNGVRNLQTCIPMERNILSMQAADQELRSAREEVAAGQASAASGGVDADASSEDLAEVEQAATPELAPEDDIDEDDIDSWI
ncbi:hypothetical protein SY83_10030 [Paenibacillus swuensis]|uniref:Uncharacterized protein n=1 Tax=Paenibacillus swuensis TaxID=1178515 RepID=A0A172TP50_9BACL|nr:hypothetical protein [Paenibacillus swuensis]ANE48835.1 hypothetical protein SY83_10030 [Paenibacillus swuensis]